MREEEEEGGGDAAHAWEEEAGGRDAGKGGRGGEGATLSSSLSFNDSTSSVHTQRLTSDDGLAPSRASGACGVERAFARSGVDAGEGGRSSEEMMVAPLGGGGRAGGGAGGGRDRADGSVLARVFDNVVVIVGEEDM